MSVDPAFVSLAHKLAEAAGEVSRRYFRTKVSVDDKADASPVTIADREAEMVMRQLIAAHFPDHGIFGEEHGIEKIDARYVWVLDPIDGTRAFITGKPSFGNLIALCQEGKPIIGIINQPITRELWLGVDGQKSTMNGDVIATRACPELNKAALYATAPEMFSGQDATDFERLRRQVKTPRFGADCYAYGLLALGFVDLVVESSLKPYDYCALAPVIKGAGGVVTDWEGRELGINSGARVCAAGDASLHRKALKVLGDKS
jgi:inositol-phosphate phosphatase/L-galactose 1-phosphate phosphatase/histidinol-phosphatase